MVQPENLIMVGNYISVVIVSILAFFYFEKRYFPSVASKYFATTLALTAVSATLDTITGLLIIEGPKIPLWIGYLLNSIYFVSNLLTTTFIAMTLFAKILEHVHDDYCLKRAKIAISSIFFSYFILVLVNIKTGIFFYFDNGYYCRGPLNSLGYAFVVLQMVFVMICFFRHKDFTTRAVKRALIQCFLLALVMFGIQLYFPNVLLNAIIMSLVSLIMYMNFQNYQPGVHMLNDINDRHRFFKYIETALASKKPFRTYVIKIKNFDTFNQKYGHKIGDDILSVFAFALERVIKGSSVFHMDNLRFAIVIPDNINVSPHEAYDRICAFFERGIEHDDERIILDYTLVEHPMMTAESNANTFYEALEYGIDVAEEIGEKYFIFTPELSKANSRRKYLIKRLEVIDREHGYEVWYQPARCMSDGIYCSMEALIRLREPDGSIVNPGEFISIAEQADMIYPLTWFVIEESCRAICENPELKFANISINMPMRQIFDRGFLDRLNALTAEYGVRHHQICLEFTERDVMDDFNRIKVIMETIAKQGYRFFLDDFGMGYSNFNCLLQLPFTTVKLDRSLTSTVLGEGNEHNIVNMLTDLFHKMNLKVVAEGAETEEQIKALQKCGVDRIQGYYYAKPMDIAKLIAFYTKNPLKQYV